MRALTLKPPWASHIFNEGKDVENRTWPTSYRGLLAIHEGAPTKAILGTVELVDCIGDSGSRWAEHGLWHWVLADPRRFVEPILCRGRQGIWVPPEDVLAQVLRALRDWSTG